jgi:acyl carrier protein
MPTTQDRLIDCFAAVFPNLDPAVIPRASTETVREWDSLALVNVVAVVQEEFGIEIEPKDYENMVAFSLVHDLVERKRQAS